MRQVQANATQAGEMTAATARVLTKRLTLGAEAIADPARADHAEFARLVPEKAQAFSQSGLGLMLASQEIGRQLTGFLADETKNLAETTLAIARCRTTAEALDIQMHFATNWAARVFSQSVTLGLLTLRSQAAVLRPIHHTVTGNARRLRA